MSLKIKKLLKDIEISILNIDIHLEGRRVIHSYDTVDDVIIWKVLITDLPVLLSEVQALLNENGGY